MPVDESASSSGLGLSPYRLPTSEAEGVAYQSRGGMPRRVPPQRDDVHGLPTLIMRTSQRVVAAFHDSLATLRVVRLFPMLLFHPTMFLNNTSWRHLC